MCVQSSSVLRVLQFTPFNVVCYVLHRPVSRVIHGQQLSSLRYSLRCSQEQSQGLRCVSPGLHQSEALSSNPLLVKRATWFSASTPTTSLHTTSSGRLFKQPSQRSTLRQPHRNIWCFMFSVMIHPLVHQRIPCYDFYFL